MFDGVYPFNIDNLITKTLTEIVANGKTPPQEDCEIMLASTCQCVAHTTKMSSVSDLINITEPLTNDSGNLLADVMISLILQKGLFG